MSSREGVENGAEVGGAVQAKNPTQEMERDPEMLPTVLAYKWLRTRGYEVKTDYKTLKDVNKLAKKLFNIMRKEHSTYCSFWCFDDVDVAIHALIKQLPPEQQPAAWQDFKDGFGNVSWDHYILSFTSAVNELESDLEEEERKTGLSSSTLLKRRLLKLIIK